MKSYFEAQDNLKFSDIYNTLDKFKDDYENLGFPQIFLNDTTITTLYYLLLGRYANSTIANYDNNQFRIRLFSIIWQYGGTWEKKVDIQKSLRELSLDADSEIFKGGKAIYNAAANPSVTPASGADTELPFINSQNVTTYKKSRLDGLTMLYNLLQNDVTEEFLRRFEKLFKNIVYSGRTLLYVTEE